MERKLTAKQEKFVECLLSGMTQSDAYRAAYNCVKMTNQHIAENASKLAAKANIAPIIAERKKQLENESLWTRKQALAELADIISKAKEHLVGVKIEIDKETGEEIEVQRFRSDVAGSAIKAIEQANKMCGYNEPDKMVISGLREYLDDCRGEKF